MADAPELDVFGLPVEGDQEDPLNLEGDPALAGPETSTEETQEPPAEEETPEAAPAPEAQEPEKGESEPALEDTEESEVPPEEYLWAGKYRNPKELEKGYRELRDLWRRTSEKARAYEQQTTEVMERARILEQTLQQLVPYIRQIQSQQLQPQYDEYGQPIPLQPQQVAPLVDQLVSERVAQMQSQIRTELQDQQERAEMMSAVQNFYEAHPEIEVRGEVDAGIVDTIEALNEAWIPQTGYGLEIANEDSLEIAYEASKRPALLKVLQMNPTYVDTDEGMQLARFEASILEGQAITQQTQSVPASQVGQTRGQRRPAVERAAGGATTGAEAAPDDYWAQVVAEYRKDQKRSGGGVFFAE